MATATVKSRKAGSGTGSAWAQYTDELATASTTADMKAGEPQYVTTTFTVPADAAPEGALWLSFSDMVSPMTLTATSTMWCSSAPTPSRR